MWSDRKCIMTRVELIEVQDQKNHDQSAEHAQGGGIVTNPLA